ncbi:roundabout homolog 2 isoform X4 [Epinephelus fuscoguttatus]|uniref:roundabout homolog 2 isoform X4 n=1 Tax=Epinephelus fuscoguttatus TaxID=293821 RepID=UPI0020D1954A|nr:roundabout homolog 2 isoform X4 [Epinephelus fuscoguttatus]
MGYLAGEREESCASCECTAEAKRRNSLRQQWELDSFVGYTAETQHEVSNGAMARRSQSNVGLKALPVVGPSSIFQLLLIFCGHLLDAQGQGSRLRQEDSPPRIVEHPSDLIVSKGEPATLNCKAEGRPVPTVEWYKDGERVETDKDDPRSHRMLLPSGSLFFLRIVHGRRSKPDEGAYVCVARNYLGEAVSRNASLEVALLRDDFRQNPTDVVVAAGEPAILECVPPRGHPEPTIYWKKDKVRIDDKDDRITIRGGKLMISNTRKSDAAMYVCVGTNMVGERDSETAQVTVFERPTFLRRPINQVVLEEETVEFRCQVQGDPQPNVRWRKDDIDVPRGRYEIKYDKDDYVLRVKKASINDEGTFTCVAENRVGKLEASASLTVRARPVAAPQFVIRPRDQIVAQGRTATFPCETKGNPQPAVFWQKEGSQNLLFPNQPQQPNSRFSVSPSGDLTISSVQRADAGYYICQALTVAGSILAKAQLEVTDVLTDRPPPIIRQGPSNQTLGVDSVALLKCQASGDPIPSISWLKDGVSLLGKDARMSLQELGSLQIINVKLSDSGIYTCVATSSSGETSWSAFLEVKESGGVMVMKNHDENELPGPPSKPQVTDVTKNSVSLSWQPGMAGASPVSSYVIEAFSQSVSNSWQTVADHVKTTQFTVRGLRPNTIYLFMVRAVNSQGLSDPSPMSDPVRTQDISPPAQGVDHRHVQKELGEVIVRLHNPVVLSPTTIQVTWTVDRQSQFIQGYRVLYRQTSGLPSPGTWQTQDVKVPSERSVVLSALKKGIVYEIKVRPYFNEFQGMDSESRTARTTEEAPSAPPQQVTVLTVGNQNSTSISISWDPPPPDHQNGIIQEYKIWCLGNETRFHVNKTVDAAIRSVVVGGLQVGVVYRVEVAASTSAGVGVKSEPQSIIIGKEFRDVIIHGNRNNSITEQITDVVKQPAFIAGIGGACWVILMGFSIWLYWRRKKRKGLSNYAVTFQRVDGGLMSNGSRPGLLNASDPGYPWLADSWPATSLPVNSSSGGPNDLSNFGRGDLPTGQGDKTGTMLSDGAIYSSIDFTTKANYNSPGQTSQATPYATTQILHSSSIHELAVDLPEAQWKASLQAKQEMANLGYSLPDKNSCNNSGKGGKKKKTKAGSKPTKANGSNWANVPLPPPPVHPLPGTEMDHYPNEHHEGGGYESDGWGPPMPVQTYLHQGMEDELEEEEERVPTPPIRGVASSPAAVSFGQQSTATLTPSPRDEMQPMLQAHLDELTRAYQLDMAKQTWHMQVGSLPPQAPAPPVGYVSSTMVSDLETDLPDDDEEEEEEEEDEGYGARHPRGIEHTPGSSMDNLDSSLTGSMVNGWGSASEDDRNFSSHRSSLGSSSDGSIFTHCSFAQALVAAADKAGYRLEGTSLSKRGKGLSHRPRPSSPFSTDGSTVGTHSLGHQRATRPTRKPRSQGTAPHRRDAGADDLPPPPEPPPCQGQGRIQGARSVSSVVPPTDRKASSLERPPMSGPLSGPEDMKSSIDRQARTSLEHHRQAQDRLGSMDRADDGRRGHKTEDGCLPYNKPSFPSPGGHSSSGTASSKGSTGPRKNEGPRQPQQWTATEHAEFLGTNGQGHYSGEL